MAELLEPMEEAPPGGRFRGRTRLEFEVCDLAAISQSFRIGEQDILIVLRKTHLAMIAELMSRLRAGKISTRNIESQRRSAFRGRKKAGTALLRAITRVGAAGWNEVAEEIERQSEVEDAA